MTISTTHAQQGAALAIPAARPCAGFGHVAQRTQWRVRMDAGVALDAMYGNSIKRTARRLGKAAT
ncbi:MAG: hypothetical protein QM733_03040 [Ilumatobacteraceae bacterium]